MNRLAKNLASLKEKEPCLAERLAAMPDDGTVRQVKNGLKVSLSSGKSVYFEKDGSASNVENIFSRENFFGFTEVIILVGVGLGEQLFDVLKSSDKTAFIILIESNPQFFKKLLETFDFSKELADPRLSISVGEDPVDAVMVRLEKEFDVFTRSNFQVIKNNLSYSIDPDFYRGVDEILEKQREMAEKNLTVITRLSSLWQKNIFANLPAIFAKAGIKNSFGKMKGVPALIVAAGPSLDKNCKWIKIASSSMLIIAVDTALKTLERNGIAPHIVCSLDALIENWTHIEGVDSASYTLVANPVTYPRILSDHKGLMMFTSYTEPMVKWIEKFRGELGENITGGSVAASAFDFAKRLGCSPIILAGQDLAFTGGRTHASGGSKDEMVYSSLGFVAPRSSHHMEVVEKESEGGIEGNLGHTVVSNGKMITWKNWFEIQIQKGGIDCVNATEGGAKITGAKIATLQETVTRYGNAEKEIRETVESFAGGTARHHFGAILGELKTFGKSTSEIRHLCSLGIKKANELQFFCEDGRIEKELEPHLTICSGYMMEIMKKTDFLSINHWRLEKVMDRLQKMQSSAKVSDKRKRYYFDGELLLIFFREVYQVAREFEKNIKELNKTAGKEGEGDKSAYAV